MSIQDWDRETTSQDIAMYKLAKTLKLTEYVFPACLPPFDFDPYKNDNDLEKSTTCIISGFGQTDGTRDRSRLQHGTVPVSIDSILRSIIYLS